MTNAFTRNEHGLWCPSCGDRIAGPGGIDEEGVEPDECPTCGFPDDIEAMAQYHCGDDDDECWNCHGERYVYDCFEEWACIDPEGGCDLCMRRCDVCSPAGRRARA